MEHNFGDFALGAQRNLLRGKHENIVHRVAAMAQGKNMDEWVSSAAELLDGAGIKHRFKVRTPELTVFILSGIIDGEPVDFVQVGKTTK